MGQKKKNNKTNSNKTAQPAGPVTYEVTVGTPSRSGQDYDKKLREQAEKEAEQSMKVAFIQQMNETQRVYQTEDSDQSIVTGEDAIKMKWKWASGLDWNPSNMLLSTWLRALAAGDYEGMMQEIEKTPSTDLPNLLERRETLYNFSALFHVIKGACMTLDESGRNYNLKCKFVNRSKQPKHLHCAYKLIELGANVNAKDMLGATPLFFCVMKSSNPVTMKIAKILLDNGADVNVTSRLGETALLQPVMMKRLDCVDFLIKHGVDSTIRDNEGGSCSDMAIMDSEIKVHLTASSTTEEQPEDDKLICALCSQPSKSRCTACFVVRYCSKECQLVHWEKHKKLCKVTKKKFTPVEIVNTEDEHKEKIPKDNFVAKIQLIRQENNEKLETPLIVLHDKCSGVIGNVDPSSAVYKIASTKLAEDCGYVKDSDVLKAYFNAVVDKDLNVRINFTEAVPNLHW